MCECIDAGGRRKDGSTIGDFIDALRSGTIADETLMRRKGDVSWTKALDHIDYRSTIGLMSNVPGQDADHAESDGAPPAYRPNQPAVVEAHGRASCRERVCRYVVISVGAVAVKKK